MCEEQQPLLLKGSEFAMYIGKDIHKEIPALFNKMRHFAAKGYRGVRLDKETNSIIWGKSESDKCKAVARKVMINCCLNYQGKTIRS